jgi:hypothetical protein
VTSETRKVLKAMAEGGHLEALRVYPRPHDYSLIHAQTTKKAGVATATVADLVSRGYIQPLQAKDWRRDHYNYSITSLGQHAASNGTQKVEDDQLVIPGTEHLLT